MKTFQARWKQSKKSDDVFDCWSAGVYVRYRRPGEVGFKSLHQADFWDYFEPIEEAPESPAPPAAAVQEGLF